MAEITVVRQEHAELTEHQRNELRQALFGMIDGLTQEDRKSWRRFWNRILNLEVGEIFGVDTWIPRHGGFHRRHMKIESSVFKAQDRMASFTQFRYWLKVGAGFVDWIPGPKGGVVPIPRSISFKKCEEDVFRQFHEDVITFLRTDHAIKYLWPHLSLAQGAEMIDSVLGRFNE
ncbi:DUF1367 family protein [Allopusillimonas ginsengisoli]|uniref:DUF1367 family protein n=1 Tax=Allopusillimonas ginsengisoli TaxID=453575 RepID=UPI0039C05FE6